jgi:hypothetical protein
MADIFFYSKQDQAEARLLAAFTQCLLPRFQKIFYPMRLFGLGAFNKLPHRLGGEIASGDRGDGF